jgi:hypothetical protein
MRKLIIRDGTEPPKAGALTFDLADVLHALGPKVVSSRWRCSNLWYVSANQQDIEVLERASAQGELVGGSDLLHAAARLSQVIDGQFEGVIDERDPWVILRAVDSSWWEVLSDEQSVLDAVRARFQSVEELSSDGNGGNTSRVNPTGVALIASLTTLVAFGFFALGFYASRGGLLIVGGAALCTGVATYLTVRSVIAH